jgi:Baseplate J-like protein
MPLSFGIAYPLQRDGNSRAQRSIGAQNPASAPVDGRRLPDLLHFWAQFSKIVLHHDTTGRLRDWSSFFSRSVPFKLAEIYQTDAEKWWETYQGFRTKTETGDQDGLELIAGYLFAAFHQHQKWHLALENDASPVSQTVRSLTETNLRYLLDEFTGIFNSLRGRFEVVVQQEIHTFFDKESFRVWGLTDKGKTDADLEAKLGNRKTILPHLLPRLDRIAEVLYKSQLAVLGAFPKDDFGLEQLVAQDGQHEPHVGLMLTFLNLFRIVQGDFNQLTERHFTFFYREVLQMAEQEAVPDTAHLQFELAKQTLESRIVVGTAVKDGKDNNKADIVFNTADELVANRASIAGVRTLFFAREPDPATGPICPPQPPLQVTGKLFVPCLTTEATSDFAPFGTAAADRQGRMGFVIGSPVLRLSEGNRVITLTLTFENNLLNIINTANVNALLKLERTAADKWMSHAFDAANVNISGKTLKLPFTLTPDMEPLAPLTDTQLNPYGGEDPLLKVLFDFSAPGYSALYQHLKSNKLTGVDLAAAVTGIKNNLVLKNDEGNIEAKKAFQPFGTAVGHRFYVQHPDFFNKQLTKVEFDLLFDAKCAKSALEPLYRVYDNTLFDRTGVKVKTVETFGNLRDKQGLRPDFSLFALNDDGQSVLLSVLGGTPLIMGSPDNFIALDVVDDPFLHTRYHAILLRQSEAAKNFPTVSNEAYYRLKNPPDPLNPFQKGSALTLPLNSGNYEVPYPPDAPYNPTVQSFAVNYDATAQVTRFVQIHPFDDSYEWVEPGKKVVSTDGGLHLVPVIDREGYLFAGLKNAPVEGNVSLLFQVTEYTGNAELALPDIEWAVLQKGNAWKKLQKDIDYSDDTEGLAQPGIIRFELPKEASEQDHTVLPSGLVWLRATVSKNAAAFDRLASIHTQVVKAVFAPEFNSDLNRLSAELPAESLKKLARESADIAKVVQPYPGFGGQAPESTEHFYRRVSERLRHKNRAVSIWDYEVMVLEEFPQIYKVKCLNHTLGLRGMPFDFEFLNGHVTVVVIPDVRKLPESAQAEPKASQNLLGDIKRFLSSRISPFVQLQVLNPRYENIDVQFKVKFLPGKDDAFYKIQVKKDLEIFLSPWRSNQPEEIQFGGEINRSSLIRFVELRDYVDYVTGFYIKKNTDASFSPALTRIETQTARSVLAAGTISVLGV